MTTTMDPITWMIGVAGWRDVHMGWYNNPRAQRFSIGMHLNTTNAFLPQKTNDYTCTFRTKATRGSWPYY